MSTEINYAVQIDLPRAECWQKLQDLSLAHYYVPGLVRTEITTEHAQGVGASRRVFQSGNRFVDETVEEWHEGHGFLIRLHRGETGKPPLFERAWFRYQLDDGDAGNTLFTAALIYDMPWGALGNWLERKLLRNTVRATVRDVALAMKAYYETGEAVGPAQLKAIKAALK